MVNRSEKKLAAEKLLKKFYFNPKLPSGFGGKQKLGQALRGKVPSTDISKWLQKTDTYTLHKPVRKNFPRRQFIVGGINALWQIDLADLPNIAKYNDGFKYILLIVDAFSKKAYARPLKSKSASEVTMALADVIETNNNEAPDKIMSDKGKEFLNSHFKSLLSKHKTHHYTSNNQEIKASMVERLQRTIKSKLFRYISHSNSNRYVDVLQDVISSYNNSMHRAHEMTPNNVNYTNQEEVWQRLYNQKDYTSYYSKHKFKIDDKVRISKYSTVFAKGYLPLWSEEIFIISKVHKTSPPVYSLKDEASDELEGTWYEPELQKVDVKYETYKIESILGQRKINGKTQYLVRWVGYPPSFDSYVNKNDLLLNYKN